MQSPGVGAPVSGMTRDWEILCPACRPGHHPFARFEADGNVGEGSERNGGEHSSLRVFPCLACTFLDLTRGILLNYGLLDNGRR